MKNEEFYHIPVAYATSNNYEYMIVSILSVLESATSDTFYDFYILIDNDFVEEEKRRIIKHLEHYQTKCSISFKNVGNIFKHVTLKIDFITKQTYFRLLLPELLTEDRCIYLDTDTIVCSDLQELDKFDLQNNYVAGVKAPGYILRHDKQAYCEQAQLPDIEQYVNAGVLVWNLLQIRKDGLVEKMLSLLDCNMESQDQDIINSACHGRISFLPFEYNVMTKYASWSMDTYNGIFSEAELKHAWNNPKIIHYADRIKPWNDLNCVMGDFWWYVCKRSCMWDYFYKRGKEEFFLRAIYHVEINESSNITRKAVPSLFDLTSKRNIAIYGAGDRARKVIIHLREKNIEPELIFVSSQGENPSELEGIQVVELGNMGELYNDKTIIIATLERYHKEIISKLQYCNFREIIPLSDSWKM